MTVNGRRAVCARAFSAIVSTRSLSTVSRSLRFCQLRRPASGIARYPLSVRHFSSTSRSLLDAATLEYNQRADSTLEAMVEYLEELIESTPALSGCDIEYANHVITLNLGPQYGTYVINKQPPNKQIWLSSPLSGPRRYDYENGEWVYKRDGSTMHGLLNEELSGAFKQTVELPIQ
ncbi:Frataxin [Ramicandelaber brevisporus]|nr:Frataxin [Ramicandelaber brevisporus]